MIPRILSAIARHNMLPAGARVIVAVSGGPDSVALLHLVRELRPDAIAGVAHFNHQLRGEESDGDEQFVAALAGSLGLRFHLGSAVVPTGNLEQNARNARREFFRSLIEQGAAERIALGHTLDDQAETVLFRMLRGAGISGLAGILPVTAEGVIRPLLEVRRRELSEYLEQHRLAWRKDSSNASTQFARNRIRHQLLPQLEHDWNPKLAEALARLADVAYEEEVWWASEVARHEGLLRGGRGAVEIQVATLSGLPQALIRRLIRQAIYRAKGDLRGIDYRHVDGVATLAMIERGAGKCGVPGLTAVRSFDWLLLRAAPPGTRSEPAKRIGPGSHFWEPAKCLIRLSIDSHVHGSGPYDTLELELRGWRAGDQYQPLGREHRVKLKELFQEARVPSWRRASWPIVSSRGKILWAKEFGPGTESGGILIEEIPEADESFDPKIAS